MPIRGDAKNRYPVDWNEISFLIREGNDWTCQECGRQCRRPGEPLESKKNELTVAHYEHDYTSRVIFLAAMCTGCHLRHDAIDAWRIRRWHLRQVQHKAGQTQFLLPLRLIP